MLNNQKGFTLIELMVVVVIIGILAAIALPNFLSMQDRAKESEVKANNHTIQLAVEDYKTQNNGSKPLAIGTFATATTTTTASTANIPGTVKNGFDPTIKGVSVLAVTNAGSAPGNTGTTTPAAGVACSGNTGYDAQDQLTPYYLVGWGKKGNVLTTLTEGL